MVFGMFALASAWSSDEEVDYVYKLFQDRLGPPQTIIEQNFEIIRAGRPGLYERLNKSLSRQRR